METYCFSIIGKIKRGTFLLLIVPLLLLNACKDIVEEDISKEFVNIILPTANDTITTNNVHFKWGIMEGADAYRLQVVEPSFSNINTFELDSLITGNEFFHVLSPGSYQFQIRGENSAYESVYNIPYTFVVDSISDLSNQAIPLVTPTADLYSNADNFTFSWLSVYAADYYEFQLRSGADFDASSTTLHTASSIYSTSYSTTTGVFSTEAAYSWGVKAINQSSSSAFTSRSLYIDLTNPNDVILSLPTDAFSNVNDTVDFSWSSGTDPGTINSPISYVMELSTDVAFGTFTEYPTTVDTMRLILATDTYYWRVKALDEAGNQSAFYSPEYSVIVP